MLGGAILLGAAEVAIGGLGSYVLDLGLMFLAGFGAISMMATANTTIQLAVPNELRGRVMAVYTTVFAGSAPIGGVFMGWLAANAGAPAAILFGGATSVVAAFAAIVWYRRLERSGLVHVNRADQPVEATVGVVKPAGPSSAVGGGLTRAPGSARR